MTDFALAVRWDLLPYTNGDGLDIGCGDARPHDWFVGVDIKGGSTPKGPNHIRDARKLKGYFADESQDFVFSSYLLNELGDGWKTALADWWGLVKPNGYLILFLPAPQQFNPAPTGPYVNGQPSYDGIGPRDIVDALPKPWQLVDARINGQQFFQVYRKIEGETPVKPDPEKVCAVLKLGAHGDALWASSVFPHLKDQGYHVILYTQETGEEVLRHDPHIDQLIKFESRVPMGELGELFNWMEHKYKNCRILVEVVEGTLLPAPQKIQYHFPDAMRRKLMNFNYLELHHMKAMVPYEPRQKFYPSDEEKQWANSIRAGLSPFVVVLVPNGSSVSKMWPYAGDLAKRLLLREDVSIVMLGDERGTAFEAHPRLLKIGLGWNVRQAMTFCQLADVVVGQETGLLNSVAFEPDVRKVVLLSHSTIENLTRDWPNTASIRTYPPCAGDGACHRLHYDWQFCNQDPITKAAACQTMISVFDVLREIEPALQTRIAA